MVRNVEVHVQLPVLGIEPDHIGCVLCPRLGVPGAPYQVATPRWRENVKEKDHRQGGLLVPLEHRNQDLLKDKLIRSIDTARIAPCPIQPGILNDLAEHLQFRVSRRSLKIVYDNTDETLEQRLIVLPLVREHPVTIVLCNLMLDVDVIDVGCHGGDQLVEGSV